MGSVAKWMLKAVCISVVILYTFPVHAGDLLQELSELKSLIVLSGSRKTGYSQRSRQAGELDQVIKIASLKTGVDEEMIRSIIKQESDFQKYAVSHKGASGYMQLMPETARDLGVGNVFDPYENIVGGSTYFRQMLDRFNGSYRNALMAYNAGPSTVERGKIPAESKVYARKVLRNYRYLKTGKTKDSL